MINIAERLNVKAQAKSVGGEDAAPGAQPTGPVVQTADQVAAYPARNLVLDGDRYFVANHEK